MNSVLDRFDSRKWLELAFEAKFRPVDLAFRSSVSLRQLERYFNEAFRLSPKQWLQRIRLSAAAQMITEDRTEKEIAHSLAFANVSHLIREFRRHFGCTPREYQSARQTASSIAFPLNTQPRSHASDTVVLAPNDELALLYDHFRRKRRLRESFVFIAHPGPSPAEANPSL